MRRPPSWDQAAWVRFARQDVNQHIRRIRIVYGLGLFSFVFSVVIGMYLFTESPFDAGSAEAVLQTVFSVCVPGFLGVWAADFSTSRYFRLRKYEPELFVRHFNDKDVTLEYLEDGDALLHGYVADGGAMHFDGTFGRVPGDLARLIVASRKA